MGKTIKRFMMTLMVATLAFGAFSIPKADASTSVGSSVFDIQGYGHMVTVEQDSSNVYVKLVQLEFTKRFDWKMELQRASANDVWTTIGSRTGYVDFYSDSSRTFTSVAYKGQAMRVLITFYVNGTKVGQGSSKIWIR